LKIELRKVPFNKSDFETSFENVVMKGSFYKETPNIAKIEAILSGEVEVECVKCLKPFTKKIEEKLKLIITDRVYNGFDDEYDVIEINSNIIDFDDIITSEIESIKLDYNNICEECKKSDLDLEI
jgi:uncharacterized metal-binding protein YceD (DUF177 family)